MFQDKLPPEVETLLRIYDPEMVPIAVTWHSDRCITMCAMRPDHHAVRVRWNLADDGRWSLIPLSMDRLTICE